MALRSESDDGCCGADFFTPPMMEDIFQAIYQDNLWGSQGIEVRPGSTLSRGADFPARSCRARGDLEHSSAARCADAGTSTGPASCRRRTALHRRRCGWRHHHLQPAPRGVQPKLSARRSDDGPVAGGRRHPLPRLSAYFAFADIWRALRKLPGIRQPYLLTTTFVERDDNRHRSGGWRPLNLERPPFCFPPPVAAVDERCLHTGRTMRDKRLGLWALAPLPLSAGEADPGAALAATTDAPR